MHGLFLRSIHSPEGGMGVGLGGGGTGGKMPLKRKYKMYENVPSGHLSSIAMVTKAASLTPRTPTRADRLQDTEIDPAKWRHAPIGSPQSE